MTTDLTTVHSTAHLAPADNVDCSKLDEVVDDQGAAQAWSYMNEKYPVPMNAEELTKACERSKEAIKVLRKYNKECYTALTQQVLSAVLRTRSQRIDSVCAADSAENKEELEAIKCTGEYKDALNEIEKNAIKNFQAIGDANIADEKLRIRRTCCVVHETGKKYINATKEKCSKYTKAYTDYYDSYTSEAMGLVCPEESKLECDKLEVLKTDGVTPKTKFYLVPLMKLVQTIDH